MALYPKAVLRLLKPDALDPIINAKLAVLHIDAGNATSLYGWWKTNGVNECHFFVKKDGVVEQYVDTKYQADAQVGGASKAISIETQGYGDGQWTAAQLASIKALLLWLNKAESIPLRVPANPYDAGVGYHSMWASSREGTWARDGRTCPGADRVKQYRTVLVPWMSEPTKTPPTPSPEEDDMQLSDPVNVRDPKTGAMVQVPYSTILARMSWTYDETLRQKAVLDAIAGKLLTAGEVEAALKRALDEKVTVEAAVVVKPAVQ